MDWSSLMNSGGGGMGGGGDVLNSRAETGDTTFNFGNTQDWTLPLVIVCLFGLIIYAVTALAKK